MKNTKNTFIKARNFIFYFERFRMKDRDFS